jgi:hypothetical protein
MTTEDLINHLANYPADTEVILYDGNQCDYRTITGFLFSPVENTVRLETDDNS